MTNPRLVIDLGLPPFVPDGWELISHKPEVYGVQHYVFRPGELVLNSDCIVCGEVKNGRTMLNHYGGKPGTLNANLLDFMLAHTELAPDSVKEDASGVFFWGTVYKKPDGYTAVRCLRAAGDELIWDHCYFL